MKIADFIKAQAIFKWQNLTQVAAAIAAAIAALPSASVPKYGSGLMGVSNVVPLDHLAWGDSFTAATSPEYVATLNGHLGITLTNKGVSGDGVADASELAHAVTNAGSTRHSLLIGINDARQYGGTAAKLAHWKNGYMALLAYLGLPASDVVGARAGAITATGSWTNDANNGNIAVKTTTAGDKLAFTSTGDVLYVAYRITDSNGASAFSIKSDTVTKGTYSCTPNAAIATQNGQTYMTQIARLTGLGAGAHSIEIISAAAGGTVVVEWVSAPTGPQANYPRVVIATIPNANSTGYAISPANASNTIVAQYNAALMDVFYTLSGDGLAIGVADLARQWDVSTMLSGDGLHPNSTGYAFIAKKFANGFDHARTNVTIDLPMNSPWAAFTTGFEGKAQYKDGFVYLEGVFKKNSATTSTIAILPAGWRPKGQDRYLAGMKDAASSPIATSFNVEAANGQINTLVGFGSITDNVSLDGMSFRIAKYTI